MVRTAAVVLVLVASLAPLTPASAVTGSAHPMVVLIAGMGSTQKTVPVPCSGPNAGPWASVEAGLISHDGYSCAEFLHFSYTGGAVSASGVWQPNPYGCLATGNRLSRSTSVLLAMLQAYLKAHPGTRFAIIGHSLGGVIALQGVEAALQKHRLPAGSIASMAAIDSPLKHIAQQNLTLFQAVSRQYHLGLSCQGWLLSHSPAVQELGNITTPASGTTISNRVERFVTAARASHVRFMTVGNQQDCLWYPTLCQLPGSWIDDRPSMLIHSANVSTLYPLGTQGCNLSHITSPPQFACIGKPHNVAPQTPSVVSAIAAFVGKKSTF